MPITFSIDHFEGPLDLLLQLVEQEKLDISDVSLAAVAEQFVNHVKENPKIPTEELADFLVVAAKLMYLKSKLLLPDLFDQELEEGPDLATQLREYQRFVTASREINKMWNQELRSFPRAEAGFKPMLEGGFIPPIGVTLDLLMHTMKKIITRLEPILRLPESSMERVVNIQDKIKALFTRVQAHTKTTFKNFIKGVKNKTEAVVSFLALLELIKQRFVKVEQTDLFHDIVISHHPEAPKADPLAQEFA